MNAYPRSLELTKELTEALREIRRAFPTSAGSQYRPIFMAIDNAEAEVSTGFMRSALVINALKAAKQVFQNNRDFQYHIHHAEKLLGYLQIELSREALAPTSPPATPAS